MTATNTPRLALPNPVDSDTFQTSDFSGAFTKLDNTPGFTMVNNFASLPTGWTTAQHGSVVIQLDNGAQWQWYQPSGGGVWRRINSLGVLSTVAQATTAQTTTTSPGVQAVTTSVTVPGGRYIRMSFVPLSLESSYGYMVLNFEVDGAIAGSLSCFTGGTIGGHSGGVGPTFEWLWDGRAVGGTTHAFSLWLRAVALPPSQGGSGNVLSRAGGIFTVSEV